MQRNTRASSFCAFAIALWAGTSAAQEGDGEGAADPSGAGDSGVLYGKVTIAGRSSRGGADTGIERMYGGVSGRAGAYGSVGPRPDAPAVHTVVQGDTLWDLSDKYYGNPWAWPQVWALNPQVENPHWIYPGDQLRTKPSANQKLPLDESTGGESIVGRESVLPQGAVFIRDQGYIGDPEEDVWGEVVGAHEDMMLLAEGATVYLLMREGVEPRLGQRLTVFHEVADPPRVPEARDVPGQIVKIYGTVRVDGYDPDTRVVKAVVIESIDAIERGFSVGPVGRRFEAVAPKPATQDVEARVLSGLQSTLLQSEEQLVFLDRGREDGLIPGNRLRVIRRGDTWRQNLSTANLHARVRVEMGSPDLPESETTPLHGDQDKFPDEVVGEILVVRAEDYSSIGVVTDSRMAIEPGDRAVAVTGY